MCYTNLNFLCQSKETLLTNLEMRIHLLGLNLFLIKEAINSVKKFYFEKQIYLFDPHVGETACQIRAYKILLLAKEKKSIAEIKKELGFMNELHCKLEKALANLKSMQSSQGSKEGKLIQKHGSLYDFFSKNGLIANISNDLFFLTISSILTKFKYNDCHGNTYIDFDKICLKLDISRKLAKKLAHYYQSVLAKETVNFIFELCDDLSEHSYLSLAIRHVIHYDDDERSVLPCYLSTKVLVAHMLKSDITILVSIKRYFRKNEIDQINMVFKSNSNGKFTFIPTSKLNLADNACVVIEGITEYQSSSTINSKIDFIKKFVEMGLANILLANMASHPQYSGFKLKHLNDDPFKDIHNSYNIKEPQFIGNITNDNSNKSIKNEYLNMLNTSQQIGCCHDNPSLLLTKHIYCDTIEHRFDDCALSFAEWIPYQSIESYRNDRYESHSEH